MMQRRLQVLFLFSAVFFIVFTVMPSSAEPAVTLRFAGQFPVEHTSTQLMKQIADEVSEKTEGRVEIRLFPDNKLGDYTLVYEDLVRGAIDMAAISIPSQFDPRLELNYINCFIRDFDEARKVFAADGWLFRKMDEFNSRLGVKLLGFQVEGFIGIGSTKPVNEPLNPEVKKGILLRVPNLDVFRTAAEAMGYRTITIPWDEVAGSLQNGFADGVNGMTPTAAYTILKGVLKYWYDLRFYIENLNYIVSMKTWEKLSEDDRKIIADACARVTAMSIDLAEKDQEKHLELLKEAGVEVHTYSPGELEPIFTKVASTWDSLAERFSAELIAEFRSEYGRK